MAFIRIVADATTVTAVTAYPVENAAAAGNTIIIAVTTGSSTNLTSVTDSAGNTYTVDRKTTASARNNAIAHAYLDTALTTSDTITVTISGAASSAIVAIEHSNIRKTSPVDKVNSASGTAVTTLAAGTTGTLAVADELIVTSIGINVPSGGFTAPAGYAEHLPAGVTVLDSADLLVTATTAENPSWSWVNSATCSAVVVSYIVDKVVSKSETVTVTENVKTTLVHNIKVSDSIIVSESHSEYLPMTFKDVTAAEFSTGGDLSSQTSASFTPLAGDLILVMQTTEVVAAPTGTNSISNTHSGTWNWTHLTFTADDRGSGDEARFSLFYAIVPASPGAGTVTVTFSVAQRKGVQQITEVTRVRQSTPVVQSKTGEVEASSTLTLTLDSTPDATSALYGAAVNGFHTSEGGNNIAPGSGFTEINELMTSDGIAEQDTEQEYKNVSPTTTINWSNFETEPARPARAWGIGIEVANIDSNPVSSVTKTDNVTVSESVAVSRIPVGTYDSYNNVATDTAREQQDDTSFDGSLSADSNTSAADAYIGGVRFSGTGIPSNARILTSVLTLAALSAKADDANFDAYVELADSPADYATDPHVNNRALSSNSVAKVEDNLGFPAPFDLPDMAAAVQEAVDRPGFDGTLNFLLKGRLDANKQLLFINATNHYLRPHLVVTWVLGINKSQTVTVTEAVTARITSFVNKSESITVTESVTARELSFIDVDESITITESVQLQPVSSVAETETITVSESIKLQVISLINVSDSVTVSESVNVTQVFNIAVSDSVTVTESVTVRALNFIAVIDGITVTENVQLQGVSLVAVTDTVTLTESTNQRVTSFINVSDIVTVTESVNLTLVHNVTVADTITVTETVTLVVTSFVNVSESITVTENIQVQGVSFVAVSETVIVSESVSLNVASFINVSDTVTITETAQVTVVSFVAISDNITVTELINAVVESYINVSDSVTVTESVSVVVEAFGATDITVSDSITVFELVVVSAGTNINVTDNITVTETLATLVTSFINISDLVTVNESAAVVSAANISVSDTITVTESTAQLVTSFINVSDAVTVTENVVLFSLTLSITVDDLVIVSESVNVQVVAVGVISINVSDAVTVSENVVLYITELFVNIFDNATVTEAITLQVTSVIAASDTVTVTDTVQLSVSTEIFISDQVTISESTKQQVISFIAVSDLVTVTENVQVVFGALADVSVTVSDSITVLDAPIVLLPILLVSVSENIAVTESVAVLLQSFVNVSDPIAVSESVNVLLLNFIAVIDQITVTESTNYLVTSFIVTSETVTVTEFISIVFGQLNITVSDLITVTEQILVALLSQVPSDLDSPTHTISQGSPTESDDRGSDTQTTPQEPTVTESRGFPVVSTGEGPTKSRRRLT